jgi:membrane-bound lytic murein transglycosylase A
MTSALLNTEAILRPRSFAQMAGWHDAEHARAWATFRCGAVLIAASAPELRTAVAPDPALQRICAHALAMPKQLTTGDAKDFFERNFEPFHIVPLDGQDGFLTGYYEPVVAGSTTRSDDFTAPILPRPDDLHTFARDERHPSIPPEFSAGRRDADGVMRIYPDRASLEAFGLTTAARPLVWLRDWTEVFLIHVQGSARIKLSDGSEQRLTYAGRNGHAYSSIGKRLIESGRIAQDAMTLDVLKSWLRGHGQELGQEARNLMQENRSYIFFNMDAVGTDTHGPIGGAGVPLHALSSIAVDRRIWAYGLPFWIESAMPLPGFGDGPLSRLFIAQDTGSAILGPARADLFLGSGEQAGAFAGRIRHSASFTVLLPRLS